MKRISPDFSPQSKRALEVLNDPKWSWNRFPRRQINIVRWSLRNPVRAIMLAFSKIEDRICK